MNSNGLDFVSVIFLAVAVVIFLYLRSILGTRTGNERRPYDPYSKENAEKGPQSVQHNETDNVVTMPDRREQKDTMPERPKVDIKAQINKYAPENTPLNEGLNLIFASDQSFEPDQFMKGAERAYEMIIMAYSEADKRTLKRLLAKDVLNGFMESIEEREKLNQTMTTQFVGFDKVTMLEAEVEDKQAEVTVKFKTSLIRTVLNAEGEIIEGDEKEIEKVTDIWTFSRPVNGRDPNWKLIATKSES